MEFGEGYTIAFKGLKAGVYDFEFPIDGVLFRAFENPEVREAACCAKVRMERSETQLVFDTTITGEVVVPCDRCLEDCRVPIRFAGRLTVLFSEVPGEYDGETMWLLPVEEEVDLAQYLYESVVLSLPYQRVHPEGACDPEMLKRFRIVSNEEFEAIEQASAHSTEGLGDAQRTALERLKRQMEADESSEES